MKKLLQLLLVLWTGVSPSFSQDRPTWIWYPGDWEIWLSNQVQVQRPERDFIIPPFWRMDAHYPLVSFHKDVELDADERIEIRAEGKYNVTINGKYMEGDLRYITVPKGRQHIKILVHNAVSPPSVWVKGRAVFSDKSWQVTAQDLKRTSVDCWQFDDPEAGPSTFKLPTVEKRPYTVEQKKAGVLVDFGKETFGFVKLHNLEGSGTLRLFFGESEAEALDTAHCHVLDRLPVAFDKPEAFVTGASRAFRYIYIPEEKGVSFDSVSMHYEYLPVTYHGAFSSSDKELNNIWEVSAYTLHLSTREFFLDGIKRDRWLWSGDAYQSYLMNYYLFFDAPSVKRTTWALRGKDPVATHINTIMDYSFYWFMGIYDYYQYTGDAEFVKQVYPRMISLMDFCLERRNPEGMVEGLPGDWVFIDWAPVTKDGELSAEQLLFCRSLEAMASCAGIMGDKERSRHYKELAEDLKKKIFHVFWDKEKGAFIHSRKKGIKDGIITRYANMFAMMFGYLDTGQVAQVKKNVLLNDQVLKITTPYMRFYELDALCTIGAQKEVLKEMKAYWGGMLRLGATSFWEAYDPLQTGSQHYEMYGYKYGKSLCHAWGASPIYLLGKYYLGVTPLKAGFETYLVKPDLAGLEWISGKVPVTQGAVEVYMDKKQIKVKGAGKGTGILQFKSRKQPRPNTGAIKKLSNENYELEIAPGKEYTVAYTAF